jgi:hypothetical protein
VAVDGAVAVLFVASFIIFGWAKATPGRREKLNRIAAISFMS